MLPELATSLRSALGVQSKRDIQAAAGHFPSLRRGPWGMGEVRLGDDTAAIPDGEGLPAVRRRGDAAVPGRQRAAPRAATSPSW